MKTVITLTIVHSKPLPDITDVICQRVWPYGGGCITDMTAEIQEEPTAIDGAAYWTAHDMAKAFHDAYEELAPEFGYETRSDTKVWDRHSNNGRLMIAVCKRLTGPETPLADEPTEDMCVAMARRVLLNKPDGYAWEEVMRLAYLDARALAAASSTGTIRVGNETFSKERMREAIKAGRAQS